MAAEQLNLLGPPETPERKARPRSRRPSPVPSPAPGEVLVTLRYPEALTFLQAHGPDAVAVLHLLVADADLVDGHLLVQASTRGVAERLKFLSKDSAHRRLRQLRRAGVLDALPSTGPTDPPSYVLHLDGTGITVTRPGTSG